MKRIKLFLLLIAFLSIVALASCGGGGGNSGGGGGGATLSSIAVTPANPSIGLGSTQQFTATGTYSDSSTQNITASVTWSSSDTTRATINTSGLATAVAVGSTTITATSGNISGNTLLTVNIVVGSSVNLPRTGQTICYDSNNPANMIACANTGQDGELQKGVAWPSPRFIDNNNGTVTDNLTGLIWLKDANCFGTRTWAVALSNANSLASGSCGLTDGSSASNWRLPNRNELRSLIDYSQNLIALPSGNPFTNVQANFYWSSSTYAAWTPYAWLVHMNSGYADVGGKAGISTYYVWPVRAGGGGSVDLPKTGQTTSYATGDDGDLERGIAWPSPRFTGSVCITDDLTGLMWVSNSDNTLRTWQEALTYANGLSLCGYDDWRLPNVNELGSLFNAEQGYIATWLNNQGFSNVQADDYWSSSTYAVNTTYALSVGMFDGRGGSYDKTSTNYVLPVRAGQ